MIKKTIIFFIFFLFSSISYSDENNDLIEKFLTKFKSINNIEFNFIQTSTDMVEKGKCFLSYPKKLICRYEGDEGKEIIVKNDALVIVKRKFQRVYYYRVANSPYASILDKNKITLQTKNIKNITTDNNVLIVDFNNDIENSKFQLFIDKSNFNITGWKIIGYDNQIINFKVFNSKINVKNNEKFEIPEDSYGNRN